MKSVDIVRVYLRSFNGVRILFLYHHWNPRLPIRSLQLLGYVQYNPDNGETHSVIVDDRARAFLPSETQSFIRMNLSKADFDKLSDWSSRNFYHLCSICDNAHPLTESFPFPDYDLGNEKVRI